MIGWFFCGKHRAARRDERHGCALAGVTVTGGVRDPDGRATDGAVVVRNGRVDVRESLVEEVLTLRLAFWGAGEGTPAAVFRDVQPARRPRPGPALRLG